MKVLIITAVILIGFIQCSKDEKEKKDKLDVSVIYTTDNMGTPIGGSANDNQWKQMTFSENELLLFKDLDTVNLSGSALAAIQTTYYGFPNPFNHLMNVGATLTQPLNADVVFKYVIVNDEMDVVVKGSNRTLATSFFAFTIPGTFSSGRYRMYFTYSAEGNEHYFKSWGNIQKL